MTALIWTLVSYTATTTYGSVSQTLKYLADIPPHPTVSTFNLQFPTKHVNIIQDFERHIKLLTEGGSITGKRKIVAIIDSIATTPGALLPWKEMVAICREAGVISVVDGAHSIGQELDINLSEVRPDFWVSVCLPYFFSRTIVVMPLFPKELSQMVLFEEGKCYFLCSEKV